MSSASDIARWSCQSITLRLGSEGEGRGGEGRGGEGRGGEGRGGEGRGGEGEGRGGGEGREGREGEEERVKERGECSTIVGNFVVGNEYFVLQF